MKKLLLLTLGLLCSAHAWGMDDSPKASTSHTTPIKTQKALLKAIYQKDLPSIKSYIYRINDPKLMSMTEIQAQSSKNRDINNLAGQPLASTSDTTSFEDKMAFIATSLQADLEDYKSRHNTINTGVTH